jgi:hypothetical protein
MILNTDSLIQSNASATLAMGGPLMYLGNPPDSYYYQYGMPFIDEQFQSDITNAGNTYGNSTSDFTSAVAQSLSNRLAGWSAGAVEFQPVDVKLMEPVLAIRIPLTAAYAFAALHLLYAVAIISLGISCLLLPSTCYTADQVTLEALHGQDGGKERTELVSDLKVAHLRLTELATLVHELVLAQSGGILQDPHDVSSGRHLYGVVDPSSMDDGRKKDEGNYAEGEGRIKLAEGADGSLQLRFTPLSFDNIA